MNVHMHFSSYESDSEGLLSKCSAVWKTSGAKTTQVEQVTYVLHYIK